MKNMSDSMQSTSKFHCLHWKISCQSLHQINNRNNNKKCEQTTQNDSERERQGAWGGENNLSFCLISFLSISRVFCSFVLSIVIFCECVRSMCEGRVCTACVCVFEPIKSNIGEYWILHGEQNGGEKHFCRWAFRVLSILRRCDCISSSNRLNWLKQWKRKKRKRVELKKQSKISVWKWFRRFVFEWGTVCLVGIRIGRSMMQ